jgi:hypothetical protein
VTPRALVELASAIDAETTAEASKASAETTYRRAWWATTWALADVADADWPAARTLYLDRTGHHPNTATMRRRAGRRLGRTLEIASLPPRMAIVAADHLGETPDQADVTAMVELLAEADADGMSLREWRHQLTGRSWTTTPENLTTDEKLAIARQVAREAPAKLAEVVDADYGAASAYRDLRHARDTAHRDAIDRGAAGMREVSRRAGALADQAETGTPDPLAAAVHRIARDLVLHRVAQELDPSADVAAILAALDLVAAVAGSWRAALTDGATAWTAEDQRLAADLGIDLDPVR